MRLIPDIEFITDVEIKSATDTAVKILRGNLKDFKGTFKAAVSDKNFYPKAENTDWTNGFHTGQYWLAWELTGENAFKDEALFHVESFSKRIRENINVDHHDMGFLYSLSCIAAWQLVGSESGRTAAIMAADKLISRFHEKGGFIQAWGELGAPNNYRLIIDCLMNLPLLYRATEETKEQKYAKTADIHTTTSLKNLVRDDYSTYHTFFFDPESGAPLKGVTHQGYRDSSPWARGQAWGMYGLALSYHYTKKPECVDLFRNVTEFFLGRLPKDGICYWDLEFIDGDDEPRDSSAAVIAACGMLEMAKYVPSEESELYIGIAKQLAGALARGYTAQPGSSDGLLLHGVYNNASQYNPTRNMGVDECNLWGDYFWMELLTRLTKDWKVYW